MSRLSLSVIAAAMACALPAAAQQPPPPQSSPPLRSFERQPYRPIMPGERLAYEMDLAESRGGNIPSQPLERIDLANRVSTLIELGRCDEARSLARDAGERQMALRARQMCRADRAS